MMFEHLFPIPCPTDTPIDAVAVSPDGQFVAFGESSGELHLVSVSSKRPISSQVWKRIGSRTVIISLAESIC